MYEVDGVQIAELSHAMRKDTMAEYGKKYPRGWSDLAKSATGWTLDILGSDLA